MRCSGMGWGMRCSEMEWGVGCSGMRCGGKVWYCSSVV